MQKSLWFACHIVKLSTCTAEKSIKEIFQALDTTDIQVTKIFVHYPLYWGQPFLYLSPLLWLHFSMFDWLFWTVIAEKLSTCFSLRCNPRISISSSFKSWFSCLCWPRSKDWMKPFCSQFRPFCLMSAKSVAILVTLVLDLHQWGGYINGRFAWKWIDSRNLNAWKPTGDCSFRLVCPLLRADCLHQRMNYTRSWRDWINSWNPF